MARLDPSTAARRKVPRFLEGVTVAVVGQRVRPGGKRDVRNLPYAGVRAEGQSSVRPGAAVMSDNDGGQIRMVFRSNDRTYAGTPTGTPQAAGHGVRAHQAGHHRHRTGGRHQGSGQRVGRAHGLDADVQLGWWCRIVGVGVGVALSDQPVQHRNRCLVPRACCLFTQAQQAMQRQVSNRATTALTVVALPSAVVLHQLSPTCVWGGIPTLKTGPAFWKLPYTENFTAPV